MAGAVGPNTGPQISNLHTIRSAEADAPFIGDAAQAQGGYLHYAHGAGEAGVRTFTTADDWSFVRLHTEVGNAALTKRGASIQWNREPNEEVFRCVLPAAFFIPVH